ncbi:cell division protein FtsN, partial [Klebsiella pneumoniae]|nr:cell division protein FtsN [Klebsiella pneumoniae]
QQQQMQQWNNTAQQPVRTAPRVETPRTEAPRTETRYQQPQTRTVQTQQPARATTQPAQPPRQQQTTNAPYQDLLQTPPHTTQRETA